MISLDELSRGLVPIVKRGGTFIRGEATRFTKSAVELKGKADLVSYVDKGAEKILVEGLAKLLPEAGFITEEKTTEQEDKAFTWIIDPLDGTTNFVHGIPSYAVSVGLKHGEDIVLGCIYEINRDECFYAWKGHGAYLNGQPIKVSPAKSIEESLFSTGFPTVQFPKVDNYMAVIGNLLSTSHGIRRMGSAAADLAYVACGRLEGFFEYNLKPWDVAAGIIIVKEAGGFVSDFQGGSNCLFGGEMVAGGRVHDELVDVIKKHWQH